MAELKKPIPFSKSSLSAEEFAKFSAFVYDKVGIKLPPVKKTMVEARLQKRLRFHGLETHTQYLDYLYSPQGLKEELGSLIDAVTTNTTDFFREPKHFEYLSRTFLPRWTAGKPASRRLRVWSAGCSTGMEPYTLAMVLSEYAAVNPGFGFSILATDISMDALRTGARGVYPEDRVEPVPQNLKKKYLLRSKDRTKQLVRIAPEVRRLVEFRQLNFMEEFHFSQPMDVIFCRNVVIYFDKPTQERLFTKFCRQLVPAGHLFIGHSESLAGMNLPLSQVVPTVYVKG